MLDFFSQLRLKRKGFSSGKKRRKQKDNELTYALQEGAPVRVFVFFLFATGMSLLAIYAPDQNAIFAGQGVKTVAVVAVVSITLLIHYYVTLTESFFINARVLLGLLMIAVQVSLLKVTSYVLASFEMADHFLYLMFPYALAPIMMSVLLGRAHGIFAAIYGSLFGGLLVPKDMAFPFIVFSLICGFVAVYLSHQVRRRGRLMRAGFFVGVVCAILGFALGQIQIPVSGLASEWELLGKQCLVAVMTGAVTAMVVGGTLPLFEGAFSITTDISWIELADLNHPLLRRMTIEAPGTYQHSLMVANLAEEAAKVVAANDIMCRVCAYFHDVGKLKKPEYYIENTAEGENPHDELTPTMSALIVIAHVKDGVDLALKHKLNQEIINIIREHHGTSLISYFYHRALKLKEETERLVKENKEREEDIPEVKEEGFRYPGPKPQSRESAIVSLADSIESASRSLQKPTPQKIEQLIEDITRQRIDDGQLDDCELTLNDLALIKASFASTLRSMMHRRIAYPSAERETVSDTQSGESSRGGDSGGGGDRDRDRERKGSRAKQSAAKGTGSRSSGGGSGTGGGGENKEVIPTSNAA